MALGLEVVQNRELVLVLQVALELQATVKALAKVMELALDLVLAQIRELVEQLALIFLALQELENLKFLVGLLEALHPSVLAQLQTLGRALKLHSSEEGLLVALARQALEEVPVYQTYPASHLNHLQNHLLRLAQEESFVLPYPFHHPCQILALEVAVLAIAEPVDQVQLLEYLVKVAVRQPYQAVQFPQVAARQMTL